MELYQFTSNTHYAEYALMFSRKDRILAITVSDVDKMKADFTWKAFTFDYENKEVVLKKDGIKTKKLNISEHKNVLRYCFYYLFEVTETGELAKESIKDLKMVL